MIQGFPQNNVLNEIRNSIRLNLINSGLQQSIDKRYVLETAHLTVVRFKEKIQRKNEFVKLLNKYRNYDFGKVKIDVIELVFNDWYMRQNAVKEIHKFSLK